MSCTRFNALELERGELDERHVAECADCRAARDDYLAVARAVRELRDAWQPPTGWESRLDRELARRARRRRQIWIGVGAAVAIATAIALVIGIRRGAAPSPPTLAMATVRGDGVRRAGSARVGDRLQLRATAGGARHAELRVYRAGTELVLRCSDTCRIDDHLEAELLLPAIGAYRSVLVVGAEPPPEPTGSFDDDTAAARRRGARIVLSDTIDAL